jgi:hypothetical protein
MPSLRHDPPGSGKLILRERVVERWELSRPKRVVAAARTGFRRNAAVMQILTLEVEAPPRPRREDFGEGPFAEQKFNLAHRRWRAEVTARITSQLPPRFGLYKWRLEERQEGRCVAVAELVGE